MASTSRAAGNAQYFQQELLQLKACWDLPGFPQQDAYLLQLLQSSNGDIEAAFQAAFSVFAFSVFTAQGGTADRHAFHMW
jgi:hypothetical protein